MWVPQEFVSVALQKMHPSDQLPRVPKETATIIHRFATVGFMEIVKARVETLKHYEDVAQRLEVEE